MFAGLCTPTQLQRSMYGTVMPLHHSRNAFVIYTPLKRLINTNTYTTRKKERVKVPCFDVASKASPSCPMSVPPDKEKNVQHYLSHFTIFAYLSFHRAIPSLLDGP